MTYVISDIHGKYDKFINMIEKIGFNENDTMYVLRDVIDRGQESIKCLRYMMQHKNIKMLRGNHEDMMMKSIIDNKENYQSCWMQNGGNKTLKQFEKLTPLKQLEAMDFLKSLPLYFIVDKYILVHAGVSTWFNPKDIELFIEMQPEMTLIWERPTFENMFVDGYTIIFGHTPTYYMEHATPMKIWRSKGNIGIDCGACFEGGQLGCLRLNDMEEFYT